MSKLKLTGGGTRCTPSEKTLEDILEDVPKNETIVNNIIKAFRIINNPKYQNIVCSISGGADSDIILDICERVSNKDVEYIWIDTGLEYQATKDHLAYLVDKYNIDILRLKAIKSIPLCCSQYGQPFLSKIISEYIYRLQLHDFKWEDESFDVLIKKYPNCKIALQWWCSENGENSRFNIKRNKYLKEFMIENPPNFKISNKCCEYAKKKVAKVAKKIKNADLSITGIRKSEGGIRTAAYKNCFTEKESEVDEYRPIFFYSNADRAAYEDYYEVLHSKCYTKYGLKRTGCAGCPYNRKFEEELDVIKQYEPKLYKAVWNIFGKSYEYTKKYRDYVKMRDAVEETNKTKI